MCSKFTGKPPCQSVISIKLFCKFTEITLRHGYFPLNLLHIFRVLFLDHPWGNVSGIKSDLHKFLFFYQRFPSLFVIL